MGDVALLGVPLDENSSFLRGPAEGPARIREALRSPSANMACEDGRELDREPRFADRGDLELGSGDEAIEQIRAGALERLRAGEKLLSLGGDHSIVAPLVRAHAELHGPLTILHVDAHPDLYDALEGNPRSHGSPFARIMEEGLARRLVQVGIRTLNAHQAEQAKRFGVEIVDMRSFDPRVDLRLEGPLYVSLDLDALDPAFVPGVSHHEPGGFTTREAIGIVQRLPAGALVGADVVELNPTRDVNGVTAMVAAKLVKELAAKLLG
jgi:arginase